MRTRTKYYCRVVHSIFLSGLPDGQDSIFCMRGHDTPEEGHLLYIRESASALLTVKHGPAPSNCSPHPFFDPMRRSIQIASVIFPGTSFSGGRFERRFGEWGSRQSSLVRRLQRVYNGVVKLIRSTQPSLWRTPPSGRSHFWPVTVVAE